MKRTFPVMLIILVAAAQLWAFVHFSVQDSPWRLIGVVIAVLLMLFAVLGYKVLKP
jgi:hypothetical protein